MFICSFFHFCIGPNYPQYCLEPLFVLPLSQEQGGQTSAAGIAQAGCLQLDQAGQIQQLQSKAAFPASYSTNPNAS